MSREKLADANRRHAELSAQIKGQMAEYEGKETTAEETARLDAMLGDLDAIASEAKGYLEALEHKAGQLDRLAAAESWRNSSAGRLPSMASGGTAAKGDSPADGAGLTKRDGYWGVEAKGEFVPLYDEDTFGRSAAVKASASPEYRAAFNRYLRANRDSEVGAKAWDVLHGAASKALSEGTDSAGGFLVPPQMLAQLIRRRPGTAILAGRSTTVNASSDLVMVPRVAAATTDASMYSSAVAVTDVGETPTAGTGLTDPVFEQVSLAMHAMKLETRLSRFLVADSAFNIEALLADEFGLATLLGKDDRFLTGNGIGKPIGITADANITTVNSGHASQLTADGIKDLVYALPSQYRAVSTIGLSTSALKAIRKLKDGDGRYLWDAGYGDVSGGVPATIEGRPYLVSDFLDDVGASAIPMFIGDLSAHWQVDRSGFVVEVLRELYAGTNQIGYQGFHRYTGAVTNPQAFRTHTVSA